MQVQRIKWKFLGVKSVLRFTFAGFFIAFSLLAMFLSPIAIAQTTANAATLNISYVDVDDLTYETDVTGLNTWSFTEEPMDADDAIRYGWQNLQLSTAYRDSPASGGAFLRVYKDDDSSEENFLLDYGSSPLPISEFVSQINPGPVTIMMVLHSSDTELVQPETKIVFNFIYEESSENPILNFASPAAGSLISERAEKEFSINISNLASEISDGEEASIKLYHTEIDEANLVYTQAIASSNNNLSFSSSDLSNTSGIADSNNTSFIAVLAIDGENTAFAARRTLSTNYRQTLNLDLPSIRFIEPAGDALEQDIDGDRKFILEVENFRLLDSEIADLDSQNEDDIGYLQIFVDAQPIKKIWPNTSFSLNEIGYIDSLQSKKSIKVQLVNKDFTPLSPEVSDTVEILYKPEITTQAAGQPENVPEVQNSSWRVVVVSLIVVLVVGGIALLITRS